MKLDTRWLTRRLRGVLGLLVAASVLLVAMPVFARGSVRLKTTRIKENKRAWKLKFTINYGSKPALAFVPMIFSFKRTVLYERALTDDSPKTPIERKVRLHNQTPINLPMDVSFGDTASGNIFKITKFSIKLTRDRDFEAGEYELSVRLASGGSIGRKVRIYLTGKNKPIDRRAMVFHDDRATPKKKKKPVADDNAMGDANTRKAAEDMGPDLSDIPDDPVDGDGDASDAPGPPEVDPKQGGCGCQLPGRSLPTGAAWLGLLALGLVMVRRRFARF